MRAVLALMASLALLLPAAGGCDSGVSADELGEVVFELPEVPGADQPFEMPALGPRLEPAGMFPD